MSDEETKKDKIIEGLEYTKKSLEQIFEMHKDVANNRDFVLTELLKLDPNNNPHSEESYKNHLINFLKDWNFEKFNNLIDGILSEVQDNKNNLSPVYLKLLETSISKLLQGPSDKIFIKEENRLKLTFEEEKKLPRQYWSYIYQGTNFLSSFESQFYNTIQAFGPLKIIDKNIVIIGANGSGKSYYSREIKSENIVVIPAIKNFNVNENINRNRTVPQVQGVQKQKKLHLSYQEATNLAINEFTDLITVLIHEYLENAAKLKQREIEKEECAYFDSIFKIWTNIIKNRKLFYNAKKRMIEVSTLAEKNEDEKHYPFEHLSDGEKAIFYYIANVLLAEKNSYIIVDEAENHLHINIVAKLWDRLEKERDDCIFIYITHNLQFASSRHDAQKLWCKKVIPPDQWDIIPIPKNDGLPEELIMEILGSKETILFCEGEYSSLDYKLYQILFPDYKVIPCGGHQQVIENTKASKALLEHTHKIPIGIIDADLHTEEKIEGLKKDSVFCIQTYEIENILCDEILLGMVFDNIYKDTEEMSKKDEIITQAKAELFKLFDKKGEKEKRARIYARDQLNNMLTSNLLLKRVDGEIRDEIDKIKESLDKYDSFYKERLDKINKCVDSRDYDSLLKTNNLKGAAAKIGETINKEYKYMVFLYLKKDESKDIRKAIKEKYFPEAMTLQLEKL